MPELTEAQYLGRPRPARHQPDTPTSPTSSSSRTARGLRPGFSSGRVWHVSSRRAGIVGWSRRGGIRPSPPSSTTATNQRGVPPTPVRTCRAPALGASISSGPSPTREMQCCGEIFRSFELTSQSEAGDDRPPSATGPRRARIPRRVGTGGLHTRNVNRREPDSAIAEPRISRCIEVVTRVDGGPMVAGRPQTAGSTS